MRSVNHSFLVLVIAVVFALACAYAVEAAAQTNASADRATSPPPPPGPEQLLREGISRLNRFFSQPRSPTPEEIRFFLDAEIAPYFDFRYMSRWAAGHYFRRMSEIHREQMAAYLSDMFLTALARNLGSFARPLPEVEVLPTRRGRAPGEVSVSAMVAPGTELPLPLEFRFYWSPEGWKIFDVKANGLSAVGFYRRYFTDLLRRHGPDALLTPDA